MHPRLRLNVYLPSKFSSLAIWADRSTSTTGEMIEDGEKTVGGRFHTSAFFLSQAYKFINLKVAIVLEHDKCEIFITLKRTKVLEIQKNIIFCQYELIKRMQKPWMYITGISFPLKKILEEDKELSSCIAFTQFIQTEKNFPKWMGLCLLCNSSIFGI